jgi:hypothetical protein
MAGIWSMNARELTDKADSIAENAFLKLIGRVGMASAFPVLVTAMTWGGNTLWDMKAEQAKLSGKVDVLTERLSAQMDDRYRGSDARRDFLTVIQKNEEQDKRLDRFEVRIDRIESRGLQGPR